MSRPECGRVTEATKQTQCPVSTLTGSDLMPAEDKLNDRCTG